VRQYWVYMVRCLDGTYYVGVTNNVEARIFQHNSGENEKSYTSGRRPVTLAFASLYYDIEQAVCFEKRLKGWNRAKKEALISKDWNALKKLACPSTARLYRSLPLR